MGRTCGTYWESRGTYRILVGKPYGRRPFGRFRLRNEDNAKMDLREVCDGGHGVDLSGSGQEQVAGSCECGNEPLSSVKCGEFFE
jgi:hypothetical protein